MVLLSFLVKQMQFSRVFLWYFWQVFVFICFFLVVAKVFCDIFRRVSSGFL